MQYCYGNNPLFLGVDSAQNGHLEAIFCPLAGLHKKLGWSKNNNNNNNATIITPLLASF